MTLLMNMYMLVSALYYCMVVVGLLVGLDGWMRMNAIAMIDRVASPDDSSAKSTQPHPRHSLTFLHFSTPNHQTTYTDQYNGN